MQDTLDLSEAGRLSLINLMDTLEDHGFTLAPLASTLV